MYDGMRYVRAATGGQAATTVGALPSAVASPAHLT